MLSNYFLLMPYESDDCLTTEFADQLIVIEDICNSNSDCHVVAGGDFNVDFARDRRHTLLLDNFCESMGLTLPSGTTTAI